MKTFRITVLLISLSISVFGQNQDSTRIDNDTTAYKTANAFITHEKNYETINNSFITGNSFAIIRSQDNPKIFVDGMPINPMIFNNTHYPEFLGSMHLLSFDLQKVNLKTLINDDKIISGYYNNALDFRTHDINLGNTKPQFEVNNFTALEYQDFDAYGNSTVTNFSAQQSYEKFGYRVSLSNGFQNDYIPENGLQRYSGNLKLKYVPSRDVSLTGFLDYSNFQDLNRNQKNILKSNRLLAYINADFTLASWLRLYGKYGLNSVSDVSERDLINPNEYVTDYFNQKVDYEYKSSYIDFGINFDTRVTKSISLNLNLGYSINGNNYFIEEESHHQHSGGNSMGWSQRKYKTKENVLYTSVKMSNKYLTVKYIFNKTNYNFDYDFIYPQNDNAFNNHVLSSNIDLIRNNVKIVNKLGLQFNYGKLSNYSINKQPVIINLPGILIQNG